MQFFSECTNPVDLRRTYRRLVREHHPDRGGDVVTFRAVQEDYDTAKAKLGMVQAEAQAPGPMPTEQPEPEEGVISTHHRVCAAFADCAGQHQDVAGYRLHLLPARPWASGITCRTAITARVGILPSPGGPDRLAGQGGAMLSEESSGVMFHDSKLPQEVQAAVAAMLGGVMATVSLPKRRARKASAG